MVRVSILVTCVSIIEPMITETTVVEMDKIPVAAYTEVTELLSISVDKIKTVTI